MRKPPIIPVFLLVLAFVGWGTYWLIGSRATEETFADWFQARRADDWVATYETLDTRGFPNRFDTTITGLTLSDPKNALTWSAPTFQILSLSYTPYKFITVWLGEQVLQRPDKRVTIDADDLRASIEFVPRPSLPLNTATVETTAARIVVTPGGERAIGHGQLSIRQTPDAAAANSYDIYAAATEVAPGADFMDLLRGVANLPGVIGAVSINATAVLDAPLDRAAVEVRRPQPTAITLDDLTADWGDLDLNAAGALTLDAAGIPTGEIKIKATNWRDMVEIARATGTLSDDWVGPVTAALDLLSGMSGNPDTLEVALRFSRGLVFVGPVPIGDAPPIRLW